VKDDQELNNYLLQLALEKTRLHPDEDTPPIQGAGLETLARDYLAVRSIVVRLGHRYDESLLNALTELPALETGMMADPIAFKQWLDVLLARLNNIELGAQFSIEPELSDSAENFRLVVSKRLHGVYKHFELGAGFFNSMDYRRLGGFSTRVEGLFGRDTYVASDDRRASVENFKATFDWMMSEARRGQHIQRYKGLGEMNPDQLFETTLDSNTRRLLQVKIEDAITADEIFTTLMGDQVEPRRDFIEKNALEVSNLDI